MPKRHNKVVSAQARRFRRVGTATRELATISLDHRLLWGMRIPIADKRGRVFSQPHHKAFMDPVLKKSGGSTENSWASGKWIHEGRLYMDRIMPFELMATIEEADAIASLAAKHYQQKMIDYYMISDHVRHATPARRRVATRRSLNNERAAMKEGL
jgi:hypothetical protein